ncbi:MAG: succinylglutamate desuccinylase/aspartoacylase family protein [Pirellulaceae bacterium]
MNRCFPGSASGSLASRMAHCLFREIVMRSDFGIDLHTAAVWRTTRTSAPICRIHKPYAMVRAFGCELILDGKGPIGSLRREACRVGCPTIVMEGGEVWKVEPGIVEISQMGIRNVLRHLKMLAGDVEVPMQQSVFPHARWIRAERGGFLQFHVKPGEVIREGQPIATNTSLLGVERNTLTAPFDGIVIGMTTLPAVAPGEPICHLGKLPDTTSPESIHESRSQETGVEELVIEQLSTNVLIVERQEKREADD